MSKNRRDREAATPPATAVVEDVPGTLETMDGLPGPAEVIEGLEADSDSEELPDVDESEEDRRPADQTPGNEPPPHGPEPIIMAAATRPHHVLCRVVGPGSVRYETTTYPEGSVAEFAECDADTMPQLERGR